MIHPGSAAIACYRQKGTEFVQNLYELRYLGDLKAIIAKLH